MLNSETAIKEQQNSREILKFAGLLLLTITLQLLSDVVVAQGG
jgi:hypothetical protein